MRSLSSARGFSLLEVMVASAVLAGAVLSAAQLFAAATASTADARSVSEATVLAWQKLEQLRSLAFTFDDAGRPVTDTTTDTAAQPERAFGGTGLSCRRTDALEPRHARLRGLSRRPSASRSAAGRPPPRGTRYRRRWAIEPCGRRRICSFCASACSPVGRDVDAARVAAMRARRRP